MTARPAGGTVVVVGSVNHDHTTYVPALPRPGETVLAHDDRSSLGGKGANQAAAAAIAGAVVHLVGRVGDDASGDYARTRLTSFGVGCDHLCTGGRPTGSAQITVDAHGTNTIVVASGANAEVGPDDVRAAWSVVRAADVLLTQGELSGAVVDEAAGSLPTGADGARCRFVLNLAPVVPVAARTLAAADPLILNETEAVDLLGATTPGAVIGFTVAEALTAAAALVQDVCTSVVITLGPSGAVAHDGDRSWHQPAPVPARVRDTTGAGDAFAGVLAAYLAAGRDLRGAVAAGVAAGSLSVADWGAASSYPDVDRIEQALEALAEGVLEPH